MIKQLILPMLLWPYWTLAAKPPEIRFINGNLPAAQERAALEGKPYFVHFTASWCMPCQWMEQNTFTDAALSDYANTYYLAVKLDFDSKEAENYKRLYNVTSLPSLLIFSAKGELIDRHNNSLDAPKLLKILYEHNQPANRLTPSAVGATPAVKVNYVQTPISRPALIPDAGEDLAPTSKQAVAPAEVSAPRTPGSYAIQVGVYGDFGNATRMKTQMEQRFEQLVRIRELPSGGKTLHQVLVGNFVSQQEAEKYLLFLERQSVRGFVKSLEP